VVEKHAMFLKLICGDFLGWEWRRTPGLKVRFFGGREASGSLDAKAVTAGAKRFWTAVAWRRVSGSFDFAQDDDSAELEERKLLAAGWDWGREAGFSTAQQTVSVASVEMTTEGW
jgi:hypothetical protein